MPQAVTSASSATSSSSSSWATAAAKPQAQDGGDSFSNVLDRAQSSDANTAPADATAATTPVKPAPVKPATVDKPLAKKAGTKSDETDAKTDETDDQSTDPRQAINPDAGSGNPDHADPEPSSDQGKPVKKAAAKPAAVEADAAAIVQLQGDGTETKPTITTQPVVAKAAAGKIGRDAKTQPGNTVTAVEPQADGEANGQAPATTKTAATTLPVSLTTSADATDADDVSTGKPKLAIQPKQTQSAQQDTNPGNAPAAQVQALALQDDDANTTSDDNAAPGVDAAPSTSRNKPASLDDQLLQGFAQGTLSKLDGKAAPGQVNSTTSNLPPVPPEAQFTAANHANIVTGIQSKLLPDGGTMRLHLDPPELGAMQIRVEMKGGVMTASFETSNDQTAKLLSHSLTDLKTSLEAQGVSVEKLHVTQVPKQQSSSNESSQGRSDQGGDSASQREQQRKEMMRRMWQKLMKGQDPVDLVA